MMRIVDVLLKNLIENAINLDQRENIWTKFKVKRHVTAIVEAIQKCGVSCSVWESTTRDGKGDSFSKSLEWTSLTGSDMKKLLSYLSSKLLVCEGVPVNAREKISQLWEDFHYIYTIINTWSPSQEMMSQFCDLAKQWVVNFNSLSHILEGFDNKNVTPYMHIMVYHVPKLLKTFTSIKQFTGQGVEKCNDDIKMIYHRKSNKHDPTAESLRVRFRKNKIRSERMKRVYKKYNTIFWQKGKKKKFHDYKIKCIGIKKMLEY